MKILSFNCRGLASSHKKASLKRLVECTRPDILLLQETLGDSSSVKAQLEKLLLGWEFDGLDARGRSGGLATGWRTKDFKCANMVGFDSGLGVQLFSVEFGKLLTVLNIYGPYNNREAFWIDLLGKEFIQNNWVVLGGDLNLTLGAAEIWGPRAIPDPLNEFFIRSFARAGLVDVEPAKLTATWRNRRAGDNRIAKRLDRFLIDERLLDSLHFVRQWVESGGISDHSPIMIELKSGGPKPHSPFKFNPAWLQCEDYTDLVSNSWIPYNQELHGHAAIHFMKNLNKIKNVTKEWAKKKREREDVELRNIEADIREIMKDENRGFATPENRDTLLGLEKRRRGLLEEKEARWRLKSRAIWLKAGDENTKFFQAYAKGRRMINTIWELESVDGEQICTFEGLAAMGINHFESLFKAQEESSIAEIVRVAGFFPRFVMEEDNRMLMGEIEEAELGRVLQSIQRDKSPGPDGWPIEFYTGFYDLLGSDILQVVEESRKAGVVHSPLNSTFLALIPKLDKPKSFNDYRPISLCNCIYKIIAKIISKRIKRILSKSVSAEQFGFLEGRQIHEAIGVAQEGIHSMKTLKLEGVVVKIDLSKAYDRVNWLYIRMLMTHLGFGLDFIRWVLSCLTSVSFSILINGAATKFFHAQRGLRQGCPLSPLLFLLVAEGLSRYIKDAVVKGNFGGIQIARGMIITHLLFVDDILIFCNGSRRDTECLLEGINLFKRATGMLINADKSTLTENMTQVEDLRFMTEALPFKVESLDRGLKYLGFLLKPNKYLKEDWLWLVGKIERRISSWSHRWLSRAGRLTLIKSVLEAIPVYWLSLAWIPKGTLEKIRRLCFNYLWKGNKEGRKLPWVSWKRIAIPKAMGGWGLKNLFTFSKALAGKVVWRLISTTSLWTRVLHKKYISPMTIMDWIRWDSKHSRGGSIIWKALIQSFGVIGSGLAWRVGNGHQFMIGRDSWAGSGEAHFLSEQLRLSLQREGLTFLFQVTDDTATTFWNQGWKDGAGIGLQGELAAEWDRYILALKLAQIRIVQRDDSLIWDHHPSGIYSPKAGYSHLLSETNQGNAVWWWKSLWKYQCPLKCKIFFWTVLTNKAPTWDNLQKRTFTGPGWCSLCKQSDESLLHLFMACDFSKKVWEGVYGMENIVARWDGDTMDLALFAWSSDGRTSKIRALPLIISWGIWVVRNRYIFEEKWTAPEAVAAQCIGILQHFPQESASKPRRTVGPLVLDQTKPWAFFDGAAQGTPSTCGGGGIIYWNDQRYMESRTGLGVGTNNYAEVMALKLIILLAVEKDIKILNIMGDSMITIKWANKQAVCHIMRLRPIIEEIHHLCTLFDNISFTHIYREQNSRADQLSKEALGLELGRWQIEYISEQQAYGYYHRPFHEV